MPAGYMLVQDITSYSAKAFHIHHYNWFMWVPKKAMVRWGAKDSWQYACQRWAIDSAKDHPASIFVKGSYAHA